MVDEESKRPSGSDEARLTHEPGPSQVSAASLREAVEQEEAAERYAIRERLEQRRQLAKMLVA